jgi:hypothetical protein
MEKIDEVHKLAFSMHVSNEIIVEVSPYSLRVDCPPFKYFDGQIEVLKKEKFEVLTFNAKETDHDGDCHCGCDAQLALAIAPADKPDGIESPAIWLGEHDVEIFWKPKYGYLGIRETSEKVEKFTHKIEFSVNQTIYLVIKEEL